MLLEELAPRCMRLNTRVSHVAVCASDDSAFPCRVWCHTDDEPSETEELRSRFVLVALPVSLLQQPKDGDNKAAAHVTFHPPLAVEKLTALSSVGMGIHNKVILRVASSDVFWSRKTPNFSSPFSQFQYLNLHAYGKTGCILAHLFPPVSHSIDNLTDDQVAQIVLDDLCKMFGYGTRPALIASVVTRWHSDKYSKGSYSYLKPGADMATHWRWLRAPHPIDAPRVAFAGEFCSDSYNQCVDGAFDTGMRAAQSVVQFGLRLHPCTKEKQQQEKQQNVEKGKLSDQERLHQQHRNRRQNRVPKKSNKGLLDTFETKARIAAIQNELIKQTKTKYCGDECCPSMDCLDRSHAGYYLTDGSDITDLDESGAETGKYEEKSYYSENTRMVLEKFHSLVRFNQKQLRHKNTRCYPGGASGPVSFAQPAQARA